jgi:RHS repeat-associated protein
VAAHTGACPERSRRDALNPVEQLDAASPPNVTAGMLTGLNIDEFFQRTDSSGSSDFLSDALGPTLALTDSSGSLNTTYTYDPFGNTTVNGPSTNSYQFTGRENDGTGLYFYRARYYSPTFQRFISQDPIGFAGGDANLYGYVRNDPISRRDETGQGPFLAVGVGAACYGYVAYGDYSNLAELNKLSQEQQQLAQEINDLRQQQNSCDDAEKQAELEQQIEQLEQQYLNLIGQYAQAHFLDSFSDAMKFAACTAATGVAFVVP